MALPFTIDEGSSGVFLMRRSFVEQPFNESHADFAQAVVIAGITAVQRARAVEKARADNARLEALAQTDPLTRVLNRRALVDRLTAELDRAARYNTVVSLLMIDLDHFKEINDTHGHVAGDDALRWVAHLLQSSVRSVDLVARYGGEEFSVVLPETTNEGAVIFAERLRERIQTGDPGGAAAGIRITASIGVATFPVIGIRTVNDMIALADEAMYRAKASGRNAVQT
jgi:two-component system, cell cycle response regulator